MDTIAFIERPPSLEDYNRLRDDVGWGVYADHDGLREGLVRSLYHVLAQHEGNTIGMGRVIGDGRITFYIQDVIVDAPYRRRGIGKEIMRRIMRYIASNAVDGAVIGLMAAKGKESFYEAFDFIGRPNEAFGKGMIILWSEDHRARYIDLET